MTFIWENYRVERVETVEMTEKLFGAERDTEYYKYENSSLTFNTTEANKKTPTKIQKTEPLPVLFRVAVQFLLS